MSAMVSIQWTLTHRGDHCCIRPGLQQEFHYLCQMYVKCRSEMQARCWLPNPGLQQESHYLSRPIPCRNMQGGALILHIAPIGHDRIPIRVVVASDMMGSW